MPTYNCKDVFFRAKEAILKELYGDYGIPKIAASELQPNPSHRDIIGEGNFAEVFKVAVIHSSSSEAVATTRLNVDMVAVKILKEARIDQLLAIFPPRPKPLLSPKRFFKSREEREWEEKQKEYEDKVQMAAEKLRNYYKRECAVWQKCSGDMRLARENNLVELFGLMDSYNDSHMPVLVSRHISEGSIESYLKNQSNPSLSDRERVLIISDAAKALCFLHSLNIVHRDIKARNILIEKSAERFIGLLADFGSCKVLDRDYLQNASTTAGECRWAPPEYSFGKEASHNEQGPGDVWALGCALLEVLQEQEPWQPLDDIKCQNRLACYEYPIRGEMEDKKKASMRFRHVEDVFYEFMKRCWQKEKTDRITARDAYEQLLELA